MKKRIYLVGLSVLALVLGACSNQAQPEGDASSSKVQTTVSSSEKAMDSASSSDGSTSSTKITKEESSKMNITELVNGAYQTVKGTWKDQEGNTLTFDDKGLVSDVYEGYGLSATDYGTASGGIYGGETGGFLIEFIPAGVTIENHENFTDTSDSKKDRIWTGVGMNSFAEQGQFYYRVSQ
ncbi:DUF6287 domain-containing protein [Streptococcus himalayensis]|uniref:DUF6287 domain-containing protein n=1 Tax=Streptococcus himalayensis TaxID=1888195 RepID=A0A917EFC9_9STRE|nr:DUF6287 domain-containing protein [Streptococcus himalayensis]GGE32888.1 hypothetical protein GCM10011510_12770 [Streptococcus himalayensis]